MYLDYYNLKKEPFHITPDPFFFYMGSSHKESYASLIYGLKNRKGFISLTGEVGLGKTTVIRTFLEQWHNKSKIKTVFVFNSNLSFKGLLLTIYSELGLELPETVKQRKNDKSSVQFLPLEDEQYELVRKLHAALIDYYQAGYNVILVIDDAQNMPIQTLENLRMLSNLETSKDKLLQIFLIGQTELDSILDRKELRQLRQRIAIRATLRSLTHDQTTSYIQHRLIKAGAEEDYKNIFTRGAIKKIYQYSQGIPRKINIVCDNALITGFGYGRTKINSGIIKEVVADLEGRHRIPRLRYALAGMLLMTIIFGTGLWFSPYRDSILAGVQEVSPWPALTATKEREQHKNDSFFEEKITAQMAHPRPQYDPEAPAVKDYKLKSDETPVNMQAATLDMRGIPGAVPDEVDKSQDESDEIKTTATADQAVQKEEIDPSLSAYMNNPVNLELHQELKKIIPNYTELSATRQEALVRMARQTSINGLLTFKRMLAALEQKDYDEASRQMIYSSWARTVGEPAYDLAEAMRTDQPGW